MPQSTPQTSFECFSSRWSGVESGACTTGAAAPSPTPPRTRGGATLAWWSTCPSPAPTTSAASACAATPAPTPTACMSAGCTPPSTAPSCARRALPAAAPSASSPTPCATCASPPTRRGKGRGPVPCCSAPQRASGAAPDRTPQRTPCSAPAPTARPLAWARDRRTPAHATIRAAYNPRAASLDSPFGAPAPAEGALGIHPALLSLIDSGLGGSAFAPAAVASAGASADSASLSALLAGLGSCSLDGSGGAPGPRHGHDQPPLESFALFSSAPSGGFLGPAGGAAWGPPAQTQAAGAASRAASFDTAFLAKQQATAQQDRVFFDARNGVPRHSAEFGRTACLF
ncbi:hypothetical protein ACKKBF_B16060 [Auxenochlorella protothecoides x Auxenochlorella symbiontica]